MDDTPAVPRRTLTVPRFSRSPSTGVWYYHVDIAVHDPVPSGPPPDPVPSGDDDPIPGAAPSADRPAAIPSAVYSVLRRYSDFLDLFQTIEDLLLRSALRAGSTAAVPRPPPFPAKAAVSPSLLGPLLRLSTPRAVLERRRAAFQALLQWMERLPAARASPALADFLGQPPHEQDGYTSLKEYTAPDWLRAVQLAAARGKEQRRTRAYTMDAVEGRRGSVSSNASSVKSEPPRRSPPLALAVVRGPGSESRDDEAGGDGPDPETEPETEPETKPAAVAGRTDAGRRSRRSKPHSDALWRGDRCVGGERTP